jgi:hypothetical protein
METRGGGLSLLLQNWLFADAAVFHGEDVVGGLGDLGVVGDDEEGEAGFAGDGLEDVEDFLGIVGVEIAGGFVGEEEAGLVGEGAGNGDALLFAAGEVVGFAMGFVAKTDEIEQVVGAVFHFKFVENAGTAHGDLHILGGGEFLEEKMELEDETDLAIAEGGEFVFVPVGDFLPGDGDGAFIGAIEQAEEIEEGAFAAAGGSHDGVDALGIEVQLDIVENVDLIFVLAEKAVNALALKDQFGFGFDDGLRFRFRPDSRI